MQGITQNLKLIAIEALAMIGEQMNEHHGGSDSGQHHTVVSGARESSFETLFSRSRHSGVRRSFSAKSLGP